MPTQVMQKLRLSLMGFAVVPDRQSIGGEPFDFLYDGDKVRITQVSNGITKVGDCNILLQAHLGNYQPADKG